MWFEIDLRLLQMHWCAHCRFVKSYLSRFIQSIQQCRWPKKHKLPFSLYISIGAYELPWNLDSVLPLRLPKRFHFQQSNCTYHYLANKYKFVSFDKNKSFIILALHCDLNVTSGQPHPSTLACAVVHAAAFAVNAALVASQWLDFRQKKNTKTKEVKKDDSH